MPTSTAGPLPYYLRQLDQHDESVTAGEAVTGGFWRGVQLTVVMARLT